MNLIKNKRRHTIKEAIAYTLTADPYSYSGELERLKKELELTKEMLATFINFRYQQIQQTSEEQIVELLEWGFDIDKD